MLDDGSDRWEEPATDVIGGPLAEEFVGDDTERIDVTGRASAWALVGELLRSDVLPGTDDLPCLGERRRSGPIGPDAAGPAKVDHLRLSGGVDEDVVRLEVAVDDAGVVGVGDGVADLRQKRESGGGVEPGRAGVVGES